MAATTTTTTTRSTGPADGPVRLLGTGPRRWRWLGVGLGLMAAGALGAAWVLGQADEREGVVVAASDLPAGHFLTPQDLTVVQIAAGDEVATLPSQDLQVVVGQTLAVPLGQGALLSEGMLAEVGEYPQADQAVVGAALEPAQFPSSLQPGAHVSVVAAGAGQAEGPVSAQVQSITSAEGGGSTLVELAVDRADAEAVARSAASGEVALVRIADGGF